MRTSPELLVRVFFVSRSSRTVSKGTSSGSSPMLKVTATRSRVTNTLSTKVRTTRTEISHSLISTDSLRCESLEKRA